MTGPTDAELLAALRSAAGTIAALDPADLTRPVPACPGWTAADLVDHTGQVHRWAEALLDAPPGTRIPFGAAPRPADGELLAWFRDGATAVADRLEADDRDREVATWAGRRPLAWWIRRLAHETTLHADDAASVTGGHVAVDPSLAVDGIDELFAVFVPARFRPEVMGGRGETMHLHATDAEGEWLVRFDPDAVVVTHEHAKGDVAVRGPAADLWRVLWTRPGEQELEVFGDAELLARWQATASF